jgi:hypothetical protein
MRQLNGIYTQRFNKRYGRVGHLFQGRFKAVLVQKDSHLLEACRYVVLNPVRANRVQRPEEWTWSSYRAMVGRTKSHGCLETDWVLSQFNPNKQVAETRYRKFVKDGITAESIWKNGRARNILGEGDFIESLSDYVKRKKRIPEIPKSERFMNRPSLKDIFRPEVLRDKRKRDKGIGEAVLEYGYTQRVVADHIGMHFASVSRILRTKGRMLKK